MRKILEPLLTLSVCLVLIMLAGMIGLEIYLSLVNAGLV